MGLLGGQVTGLGGGVDDLGERVTHPQLVGAGVRHPGCLLPGSAQDGEEVVEFFAGFLINVQGGDELEVSFKETNGDFSEVRLSGPAEFVFEGRMEI